MIHLSPPENFNPKFEVVGCFLERDGKFLLLHRVENETDGNTWGVPAGKINPGETPEVAIDREIFEETGFRVGEHKPTFFKKVFVRFDDFDVTYHMFHRALNEEIDVQIRPDEHKAYKWVTPAEALQMSDLIPDEDACIKLFYSI